MFQIKSLHLNAILQDLIIHKSNIVYDIERD